MPNYTPEQRKEFLLLYKYYQSLPSYYRTPEIEQKMNALKQYYAQDVFSISDKNKAKREEANKEWEGQAHVQSRKVEFFKELEKKRPKNFLTKLDAEIASGIGLGANEVIKGVSGTLSSIEDILPLKSSVGEYFTKEAHKTEKRLGELRKERGFKPESSGGRIATELLRGGTRLVGELPAINYLGLPLYMALVGYGTTYGETKDIKKSLIQGGLGAAQGALLHGVMKGVEKLSPELNKLLSKVLKEKDAKFWTSAINKTIGGGIFGGLSYGAGERDPEKLIAETLLGVIMTPGAKDKKPEDLAKEIVDRYEEAVSRIWEVSPKGEVKPPEKLLPKPKEQISNKIRTEKEQKAKKEEADKKIIEKIVTEIREGRERENRKALPPARTKITPEGQAILPEGMKIPEGGVPPEKLIPSPEKTTPDKYTPTTGKEAKPVKRKENVLPQKGGKQTFKEFVESKGIPWEKVSGKKRDIELYNKLFAEYQENNAKEAGQIAQKEKTPKIAKTPEKEEITIPEFKNTEEAIAFGKEHKGNKEIADELRRREQEVKKEWDAIPSDSEENINEKMKLSVKKQLYREAREVIEGKMPAESEVKKPEQKPEVKAKKEPWEMTREEFLNSDKILTKSSEELKNKQYIVAVKHGDKIYIGKPGDIHVSIIERNNLDPWEIIKGFVDEKGDFYYQYPKIAHKDEVKFALKEGKPVPEEVLKEYPDLAKKYSKAATKQGKIEVKPKGTKAEGKSKQGLSGKEHVIEISGVEDEQIKNVNTLSDLIDYIKKNIDDIEIISKKDRTIRDPKYVIKALSDKETMSEFDYKIRKGKKNNIIFEYSTKEKLSPKELYEKGEISAPTKKEQEKYYKLQLEIKPVFNKEFEIKRVGDHYLYTYVADNNKLKRFARIYKQHDEFNKNAILIKGDNNDLIFKYKNGQFKIANGEKLIGDIFLKMKKGDKIKFADSFFKQLNNYLERANVENIIVKTQLSGKEFVKGLVDAIKKDMTDQSLGIVPDPYRNLKDFLKKHRVELTDEERAAILNYYKAISKGFDAETVGKLMHEYLSKNFSKFSPVNDPSKPIIEKINEQQKAKKEIKEEIKDKLDGKEKIEIDGQEYELKEKTFNFDTHKKVLEAIGDEMVEKGIKRDPENFPVFSDQIVDLIRRGEITYESIKKKYDVSETEWFEFWRNEIGNWARGMQRIKQIQDLVIKEVGIVGKELEKVRKDALNITSWDKFYHTIKRIDNIRRGLMVGQISTHVRNAYAQTIRLLIDTPTEALAIGLGKVFKNPDFEKAKVMDALNLITNLGSRNRKIVLKIMEKAPHLVDDLYRRYASDVLIGSKRGMLLGKAEKVVEIINTTNNLQEFTIRDAAFLGKLEAKLAEKGIDIRKEIIELRKIKDENEFNRRAQALLSKISKNDIKEAIQHALDVTWADTPKSRIARDIIHFVNSFPMLPWGTGTFPFMRFVMLSTRFIYQRSPFGLLSLLRYIEPKPIEFNGRKFFSIPRIDMKKVDPRIISKAVVGSIMLGTAYLLRDSEYAGEKWYELKIKNKYYDMRMIYPFASYLFIADVIKRAREGNLNRMSTKDWLMGIASVNVRAGLGSYMLDEFANMLSSSKSVKKVSEYLEQYMGQLGATFLTPLNMINDFIAGLSEESAKLRNTRLEPMAPIKEKIPVIRRKLPEKIVPLESKAQKKGYPWLKLFFGVIRKDDKNILEKETDRLDFSWQEVYPNTGDRKFDYEVIKEMGRIAEKDILPLVKSKRYKEASDVEKAYLLSNWLRTAKKQARARVIASGKVDIETLKKLKMKNYPKRKRRLLEMMLEDRRK